MTVLTPTPPENASFSLESLQAILSRSDLDAMCKTIFNCTYEAVQKVIYPKVHYKTFFIKKKSGGFRIINEPHRDLKGLQSKLLEYLYQHSGTPKNCVHGFTKDRSIVTNARVHC